VRVLGPDGGGGERGVARRARGRERSRGALGQWFGGAGGRGDNGERLGVLHGRFHRGGAAGRVCPRSRAADRAHSLLPNPPMPALRAAAAARAAARPARRLAAGVHAAAWAGPAPLPPGARTDSGFLPLPNRRGSLFYLLQAADVANAPIAVWLQGGPGASSLTGCFHEHGRWTTDEATGALHPNPHAWAAGPCGMHMLYVEQPAGTGFSKPGPGGPPRSVAAAAADLVAALTAYFHGPGRTYADHPLLLTGESHVGRFVPESAAALLAAPPAGVPRLAGVAVGNGVTDPRSQTLTLAPYLHAAGLLDAAEAKAAAKAADHVASLIDAGRYRDAHDARQALLDDLTERCLGAGGTLLDVRRARGYDPDNTVAALLRHPAVVAALGVPADHPPWIRKSPDVKDAMWADKMVSSAPAFARVLSSIPALLYQGVADAQDGPLSNEAWVEGLQWPRAGEYGAAARRPLLDAAGGVAGHARSGGGLTTASIRDAGHMSPRDAPGVVHALVQGWAARALTGGA